MKYKVSHKEYFGPYVLYNLTLIPAKGDFAYWHLDFRILGSTLSRHACVMYIKDIKEECSSCKKFVVCNLITHCEGEKSTSLGNAAILSFNLSQDIKCRLKPKKGAKISIEVIKDEV